MKRIYVCCILLILLLSLAVFNGVFTEGVFTEGFQTAAPCNSTVKDGYTYWFCDNKNKADDLIEGNFAAASDSICIRRGSAPSTEYSCLERDKRRSDRRFLLTRQKKAICDLLNKNLKDISDNILKGDDLNTIAATTLATIESTEPNIEILKKRNPRLTAFLNEKDTDIKNQKNLLNAFINDITGPINNSKISRDRLKSASDMLSC